MTLNDNCKECKTKKLKSKPMFWPRLLYQLPFSRIFALVSKLRCQIKWPTYDTNTGF